MYNLEEFKKLVAEGKIKDKWYFYKRTEQQKQTQAEEIPLLVRYFKNRFNVILYPMYGTLLGIIREKDFILYDNDVDLAYLSLKTDKESVLKEFEFICEVLQKEELLTKIVSKGQLHCYGDSKTFKYDVWTSWIENDNLYYIVPIKTGINKSIVLPFKTCEFRKTQLPIPNNPDKILNFIYNNWKEPISDNWRKQKCKRVL
jgi:phosphorylcholine metabolism protein LicD